MGGGIMKKPVLIGVLACSIVPLLQGCSVARKLGLYHPPSTAEQALAQASDFTAKGRKQLDAGNFALAAEAFQQALAQGEAPAPAFNGMGVSYAHMGRADLAATYFREAMANDPAEAKYANNLALLMKDQLPQTAQSRPELAEAPPTAAPVAVPTSEPLAQPAATTPSPRGRLVQVAPREFMIRTQGTDGVNKAEMARAEPNFHPVIHIDFLEVGKRRENGVQAKAQVPTPAKTVQAEPNFRPVIHLDFAKIGKGRDAVPQGKAGAGHS